MELLNIKYNNCSDIINHIHYKELLNELVTSQKIKEQFANLPLLQITKNNKDLKQIKELYEKIYKTVNQFCILGTGGSSLGAQALIGLTPKKQNESVYFYDNIDPLFFENNLNQHNLSKTCFVIISKSGSTAETLGQLGAIIKIFIDLNIKNLISKNFIIITENRNSPLNKIATKYKILKLEYEKEIGGRFSVFSNVGLFPAFIAGIDINEVRNGAKEVLNCVLEKNNTLPFESAALLVAIHKIKKVNINVLLTYNDSLIKFGEWFRQLWSESLGKNGLGSTPIHSIGTTDQHSQLQLYIDGPKDKFFSFIKNIHSTEGLLMDYATLKDCGMDYIAGKKMGDLMEAEQNATLKTLINNKLPVREIQIDKITPRTLGGLMMYYFLETISAGLILNIDPFNQPAVEESKKLTRNFLSI